MRHGRGKDVGPLCYGNNFGCFQFLVFSFLDFFHILRWQAWIDQTSGHLLLLFWSAAYATEWVIDSDSTLNSCSEILREGFRESRMWPVLGRGKVIDTFFKFLRSLSDNRHGWGKLQKLATPVGVTFFRLAFRSSFHFHEFRARSKMPAIAEASFSSLTQTCFRIFWQAVFAWNRMSKFKDLYENSLP